MTGRTLEEIELGYSEVLDFHPDERKFKESVFPHLLAIAQGQREEVARLSSDSTQLARCIAEFDRIKIATMSDAQIPLMHRMKDSLYLDGVLAMLTTKIGDKNAGYRQDVPTMEIDRELDGLYGRLHMAAMDFVAGSDQKELACHAHIVQAVCALREYFHLKQEDRLNKRKRHRHQKVST